ncbi:MAG: AarF/UbiB family protein, partial [Pseudomonadota bacterium]
HLTRRLTDKIKTWEKAGPSLSRSLHRDILTWVGPWENKIDALKIFSLSHGDPNPGNIMVQEEGRLFLLDTGHIRYLPRALDLYMLEVHLCEDNRGKIKLFEAAYFKDFSGEAIEAFKATEAFFRLYVFIDFATMLARRLAHTAPGGQYYDEYVSGLARVRQMIAEIAAAR